MHWNAQFISRHSGFHPLIPQNLHFISQEHTLLGKELPAFVFFKRKRRRMKSHKKLTEITFSRLLTVQRNHENTIDPFHSNIIVLING
ncbi:hypothetical protein DLM76_00285 [Leptospira yasudae]|nr:hypothetical protein DLM76_00285 [Leptospira yasudae]